MLCSRVIFRDQSYHACIRSEKNPSVRSDACMTEDYVRGQPASAWPLAGHPCNVDCNLHTIARAHNRSSLHLRARFSSRRRLARWRCPLAWLVSCGIPTDSCAASGPSCPRTPSRPSRWPSSWRATSTVHAAHA